MQLLDKYLPIANALYKVRTESGTVYRKTLSGICGEDCNKYDPVDWINEACGIDFLIPNYKNKESNGSGLDYDPVCTNVDHRFLLDLFLDEVFGNNIIHLTYFSTKCDPCGQLNGKIPVKFTLKTLLLENCKKHIDSINTSSNKVDPLNKERKEYLREKFKSIVQKFEDGSRDIEEYDCPKFYGNLNGSFKKCFFSSDDIENLQLFASSSIERFDFSDSIFSSDITFRDTHIINGMNFRGACFEGHVIFKDCILEFVDENDIEINFRDAIFKKGVSFENVKVHGSAQGKKITFEDAQFEDVFNIQNCDLGDATLYCFQSRCDEAVNIIDSKLSNSEVDFSDAKVNTLSLRGINSLPICKLNFNEAQSLSIQDCDIQNVIYIQNVQRFTAVNISRLAPIISAEKWRMTDDAKQKHRCRVSRKAHPLIQASMKSENSDAVPAQMLLLKENFNELGQYDAEDQAFLLYMRNRKVGKLTKVLFMLLDTLGSFGISPLKTFVWLVCLIAGSTIFYLIHGMVHECENVVSIVNILYQGFANIFGIVGNDNDCAWCKSMALFQSYFGWFITGYFSIAIVRKTLR